MTKRLLVLIIALAAFIPRSAAQNNSTAVQDGTSMENAVVIDERSHSKGAKAEYKWIDKHYPGYKLKRTSFLYKETQSYDIVYIETKTGESKTIYFDITKLRGKR